MQEATSHLVRLPTLTQARNEMPIFAFFERLRAFSAVFGEQFFSGRLKKAVQALRFEREKYQSDFDFMVIKATRFYNGESGSLVFARDLIGSFCPANG